MKKVIIIIFSIFAVYQTYGQTADITEGCVPLTVNFNSPMQSGYFWDFKDGASSDIQNPEHVFSSPGIYNVTLFDGVGGTEIGQVTITVYPDPQPVFSASSESGCSPFQVSFTNESIIDPGVVVTGYLWNFGDGNSSADENPVHTFLNEGTFNVSLEIQTLIPSCNVTEIFEDYITVAGNIENVGFQTDKTAQCNLPAQFVISNNTVDEEGYTYLWDFGNGDTSMDYDPGTVTYTENGIYTITMTVDNGQGCDVKLFQNVFVGPPVLNLNPADTICISSPYTIVNPTQANSHNWAFGTDSSPSNSTAKNPTVTYSSPGPKIVTYTAFYGQDCKSDTFFTIYVEDPSAEFTFEPKTNCHDPALYTFTNPNPNYSTYKWTIEHESGTIEEFLDDNIFEYNYDEPDRDSFYIPRQDTFWITLEITSKFGCEHTYDTLFLHRAPEAHLLPNKSRGCAPLTVNFADLSKSIQPIIDWEWSFGDGTVTNVGTSQSMSHTYTEPGTYWVNLEIENDVGCKHRSAGFAIHVGEQITSDFDFSPKEICLYESIELQAINLDPRIDAYHFNTDGGRVSHCYTSEIANHEFVHTPGTFPVELEIEYNGCFSKVTSSDSMKVNGSKSRIQYMTNCIDPYTVMFQDSSVNASSSIWFVNGDTISTDTIQGDIINYTFPNTGVYDIYLVTDDDSPCMADTSMVTVHIKDIKADFDLPEFVCAYAPITIDASASIDVDTTCSEGYLWYGIHQRPRLISANSADAAWFPGEHTIRLITEDVNGCKDTLDKMTTALDLKANFESDLEKTCFPALLNFSDLSTGDTTIVSWDWSFGNSEQNPMNVSFTSDDGDESLPIQLIITDELGCMDTLDKAIEIYLPTTDLDFDPSQIVCVGETINITATDFTDEGSFLNYMWTFGATGEYGTSIDQNVSIDINNPGIIPISLIIEEDATGCTNVYDFDVQGIAHPIASFAYTPDDIESLCPPANIAFTNNSTIDGPGGVFWFLDGAFIPNVIDPEFTFSNGETTVQMIASSVYGCNDTTEITINLSAPEGNFDMSDLLVCKGEAVTFNLIDTMNISSWAWDFGQGTELIENQDFVEFAYDFHPPNGFTTPKLVLKSSENGCETVVERELGIFQVIADFEYERDTSSICDREVTFNNLSTGATDYLWDFGTGETSTNFDEIHTYFEAGLFDIKLSISDDESGCTDEVTDTISFKGLNKALIPTVFSPNGDDINDFFDIIIPDNQRECIDVIKCKIFNRWGNIIYNNEMPLEGWDGRSTSGDVAPAEVYTYVMEIEYTNGDIEAFKGMFTLLK